MGDGLTGEPSEPEPKTWGEVFDEAFPHYLAMGMTPEQYWDGESWLKRSYRKAYRIRMENEERTRDRDNWMMGIYIREALQSLALLVNGFVPKGSKPGQYPDKPMLEKQAEEKREEKRKQTEEEKIKTQMAMFHAMAERFNQNFRRKQESEKAITT